MIYEHTPKQREESILTDLYIEEIVNEEDFTCCVQIVAAEMFVRIGILQDRYQVRRIYFGGPNDGEVRQSPWCHTAPRAADTWRDQTKTECPLEAREIAERGSAVYKGRLA